MSKEMNQIDCEADNSQKGCVEVEANLEGGITITTYRQIDPGRNVWIGEDNYLTKGQFGELLEILNGIWNT